MARDVYRGMIERLKEKESKKQKSSSGIPLDPWYAYILRCSDGTFYSGIAHDVAKRLAVHQKGKGARFTRTRLPVELVYQEQCDSHSSALIREYKIKSLSRLQKMQLINGERP